MDSDYTFGIFKLFLLFFCDSVFVKSFPKGRLDIYCCLEGKAQNGSVMDAKQYIRRTLMEETKHL
jgi:hypothetical protein